MARLTAANVARIRALADEQIAASLLPGGALYVAVTTPGTPLNAALLALIDGRIPAVPTNAQIDARADARADARIAVALNPGGNIRAALDVLRGLIDPLIQAHSNLRNRLSSH